MYTYVILQFRHNKVNALLISPRIGPISSS
nr:MAG TPA: hypothetical protein [Caudoviricetes sp.]